MDELTRLEVAFGLHMMRLVADADEIPMTNQSIQDISGLGRSWLTSDPRVVEGDEVVATHVRSFDRGAQIENPAHLEDLVAAKREGRAERGMDRLHHAVPSSAALLEGAAQRGHNLGAAVAGLLRLVNTWGASAVELAVVEAIEADALHVAAVRQSLERRLQELGDPPPVPVALPDDPRVRDMDVQPHDLATYDLGGGRG